MQENQDEGGGGSGSAPAADAGRLDQDPQGVKWVARSPGWSSPPFSFRKVERTYVTSTTEDGADFLWEKWVFEELRLSPQASLLVVQGFPLQNLFEHLELEYTGPDPTFKDTRVLTFLGPFLLLKAEYQSYYAPPRLKEVVLASVVETRSATRDQVLAAMLQSVLPPAA